MAAVLHEVTNTLTNECFPWRDHKIRSTDDPWITDVIRVAIRKRKRRFKKYKRAEPWQIVKEETNKLIRESKKKFYDDAVERLKHRGGGTIPYSILKELAIPDRPKPWTINMVNPRLSDRDLADQLANFFSAIPTNLNR